jgi:iron(III) transport system substrate-binding protein
MKSEDDLSVQELKSELVAARQRLDDLTPEAVRNDDKFRRTQQREFRLLRSGVMHEVRFMFSCLVLVTVLTACESKQEQTRYDPVVVWVSYEDESYLPEFFADFTSETGVPVTIKYATADLHIYNLIENIGSQPADVFMTRNIAHLWRAAEEGALRPIQAGNLENVPDALKDGDGLWTAINYQQSVIVHRLETKDGLPQSFSDLGKASFEGRLCVSTSRLSVNKEMVAIMIAELGVTPAERLVRRWMSNLATAPFESEKELLNAVIAGDCEFGILSGWGATCLFSDTGQEVKIIRGQPAFTQIEGVGVGRHSRYPQSAHVLVDWILSEEVNQTHARSSNAYPIRDQEHLSETAQPAAAAGWRGEDAKLLVERAGYR